MTDKKFLQNENITIYNDDVLTTQFIADESIDLIVTSPPYNVDIQYNSHDDQKSYKEYLAFTQKWMSQCYQWLKKDGRFCLNIPLDKNKGGQKSIGADLQHLQSRLDFNITPRLCGMKVIFHAGQHGGHG